MDRLKAALEHFLAALPRRRLVESIREATGRNPSEITTLLDIFSNEARATLDLVAPHLDPDKRLLEVGAGLCLFSLFLRRQGFRVTALEPGLGGYGFFAHARRVILEQLESPDLEVLSIPAERLCRDRNGCFDLIFSNNVIEHIPNWRRALEAMLEVLQEDGLMIHACPNYTVPYEPHYGIPVFRHAPELSRKMFLPADADLEVWHSLNFITLSQVRGFARRRRLRVHFRKALLARALERLHTDPWFRQRHTGVASGPAHLLASPVAVRMLRRLPPAWATPMVFELKKIRYGSKPGMGGQAHGG